MVVLLDFILIFHQTREHRTVDTEERVSLQSDSRKDEQKLVCVSVC